MTQTRTETDSFGPLEVPADKYWGAQTQRSIMNFPIGWEKQPVPIIRALGVVKKACAMANKANGAMEAEIADAIIAMAHRLSLDVIAEGVETPEQCRLLRESGCRLMQGYLFARPVPAEDLTKLLPARDDCSASRGIPIFN